MKDSKKSRHKRSEKSSESSSSRRSSSRSSQQRRHKKSHKSKHRKEHKSLRSRSYQRERSRSNKDKKNKKTQKYRHANRKESKDNQKQNDVKTPLKHQQIQPQISDKYQTKREEILQKNEDVKHSPVSRQQIGAVNQQTKPQKQLPCFEPSGILLQFYNARQGVSLRFHQPPQSRQPTQQWRMYIFKGEEVLQPITLSKSCYLIGKDERVTDILAENPSISRQHAVIQFRLVQKRQTEGDFIEQIKPYVMDLESTNGTSLNDEKIEPGRYYELLHRDVLKFGFSDREYVIVKWQEDQQE